LGSRGSVEEMALFDAGASKSFVDVSVAERLGHVRYEVPKEVLLVVRDHRVLVIGGLSQGLL
jgi:hypothetical protein